MRSMDRRGFLAGTASLGAGVILSGCGSSSSGGSSASASRPKIGQEPGNMVVLEWDGYQAAGTKAQTTKGIDRSARTTPTSSAPTGSPTA